MSSLQSSMSNETKFVKLINRWIIDTESYSSISAMMMHDNYQELLKMGDVIIKYLIDCLKVQDYTWHYAILLSSLTQENPVQNSSRGNLKEVSKDWLYWWDQRHSPLEPA